MAISNAKVAGRSQRGLPGAAATALVSPPPPETPSPVDPVELSPVALDSPSTPVLAVMPPAFLCPRPGSL
ncbi:hypothetical protein NSK11_contig00100-0019 [Nocardia seriolae]|uniref:Uncharacterized protein n=1 Tax=Nocardia seriolae TaxID=37332 RepID=A0ABC9Z0K2_9NOCA|nr:hypothetical protein NS07_v2contig00095-0019 [Nocardia seriolae]GAP30990.1 hypothetical protein NSK11_contig00100-0019 [Nocardia seriolae]